MKTKNFGILRFLVSVFLMMAFVMSFLALSQKAHAQGMTSVNVTGIPPIIEEPFTDKFEQNFRNGRYQVIFTYNNSNTNPVNFRFRFKLSRNGEKLIDVTSNAKQFQPGAYVFTSIFQDLPFNQTFKEVISQVDSKIKAQLVQEGTIPEGNYTLSIEPIPDKDAGMISSPPSVNPFTVRYPQPPILLNPTDHSSLTLNTPIFNWTPVAGVQGYNIQYHFLLVEVLDTQTPLQALNSNRAYAQKTLTNQVNLIYTPEFLPLEEGKEYAWQVTASTSGTAFPFKNDGASQIRTFVYKKGAVGQSPIAIRNLSEISLIPEFASLINLDRLHVREQANSYILDGDATLQLKDGQNYEFPVNVRSLKIRKMGSGQPTITGGEVLANRVNTHLPIFQQVSQIVDFTKLRWVYGKGVQATGNLQLPNGLEPEANGWVQLTSQGLSGHLVADNPNGVVTAGKDPVKLTIDHFEASFPARQLYARGEVDLFDGEFTCDVTQLNVLEDQAQAVFNCPDDASVSLVGDSAQLKLLLDNLSGTMDYDFGTDQFAYDLNAQGNITFGMDQAAACSAFMQVNLSKENGFRISQVRPSCSMYAPPLDLGFMKLKLNNVDLQSLAYNSAGDWDFDIGLDGSLIIPAMDGWVLPLTSIDVTSKGLEFPDLDWDAQGLGINQPLEINGFGIKPTRFSLPKFTFPLFKWTPDELGQYDTGDWSFNMDFDFNFPDFGADDEEDDSTGTILPSCLVSRTIQNVQGNFEKGSFSANIPATVLRGCQIDLAEGYTFYIDELGGTLGANASDSGFNLRSEISLDAHFKAGSPFNCGDDKPRDVGSTSLSMDGESGLLEGSIKDIVDNCEADLGPFQASITQSDLIFSNNGNNQKVTVDAAANLELNKRKQVSGNFSYDVINGHFDELNFKYEDPFVLSLPSQQQPILSFLVDGLSLTKDGILIDGRQEFIIGDAKEISRILRAKTGKKISIPKEVTTIGVTFDNALIGLEDFGIKSGRIIFDKAFALQAGLDDQSADINFKVAADTSNVNQRPNSAFLKLGGRVYLDKNGLHSRGQAEANVRISDLRFEDLELKFSRSFAMGFEPFGVKQGQADLYEQSRRVAYINSSGFHLDPSYLTQAIPDTLGLPNKETAFLVLRDQNDSLLVQAQQQNDGSYIMSTINPVDLVIPAIQGSRPAAPKVGVSFTNITYDPSSGEITDGAIRGDFNPAIDLNDIGVPFKLRSISYDDGIAINDKQFGGTRGLFLEGDLLLYKQQIGDSGNVALYLENGSRLRGDVDLNNLDSDISVIPQNDMAVLHVDSLEGTIDVPLDELVPPDISLDLGGQFRLQRDDQTSIAALNYYATYDNGNFGINALSQPQNSTDSDTAFVGATGFRIDQIKTLDLSYSTVSNDFDFRSELDFSVLMNISDGDTLEVPLHSVAITENGFSIPAQTINRTSTPSLNAPSFTMGPATFDVLVFRILHNISYNWFSGGALPTLGFNMDMAMKLSSLSDKAPQASSASVSLNSVGYNRGVFTGTIEDYTPQAGSMPISLGPGTYFNLTSISGGLTNTGTNQNPVQGYDISLGGNFENEELFGSAQSCSKPSLNLNLSRDGGLVGSANNITPCGQMEYGPATLAFDPNSSLTFSFNNDVQNIVLAGGATAEIEQDNSPNITANGNIEVELVSGDLINGSILVNDLFTYKYPQNNPLFTFRIQHARLNQHGLVFNGDAGLTFPNSQDTAKVEFTNFTIHPQNEDIASGSLTIQDSVAFEVGISPVNWKVVDPSSNFNRDNAGRILAEGGIVIDSNGLSLSGSSTASVRAAGQSFPDLTVDYTGFKLGFNPVGVNSGRADFTVSDDNSSFGYLDKDQFHLDLPGLITSVIPDTLNLPNRQTAYLVLGDNSGDRYELDESQSPRHLRTLNGKTAELVIPNVKDANNDPLKVQVSFDLAVDDYLNVSSGSISLENPVDLEPYLDIPLSLENLNYDSNTQQLLAAARVTLPSSLNGVKLTTSAVIGNNGFEEATISAGEYSDHYFSSQENVTPIAADTLGNDALEFYVRGLEIELGTTNSIAFSGQLKSDFFKDNQGAKTPIHYAAMYNNDGWDVAIDDGNLSSGIDLGYAKLEPSSGNNQDLFTVAMDQQKLEVTFSAVVKMPELLGDGFSLEVNELKLSTMPNSDGDYVTINAQQNLPDQDFELIGGVLQLTSNNTSVSITNNVLSIETSGTFNFYNKQDLSFQDLVFKSDGTVDIGGVDANLLQDNLEVLPDSSLVLEDLTLGVDNNALKLTANGFASLPKPLNERAGISISADTDGNVDISGPDFIFDTGFSIDGTPNEFSIASLATLEVTGLGVNIDFKNPDQTALYAAGAIYMENDTDKRIMFGDAGNLQQNPGIKYSPAGGVEWNVSSNFDPNSSPLSFKYEFFDISVTSLQINTDVAIGNKTVPFQAEIGGKTGLNIEGVGGSVDFAGFKFSTKGVDDIGHIDGGGTFTLMDIVSLELGNFSYETAPEGQTISLNMPTGSGDPGSGASVDSTNTVEVTKYLHFAPSSSGQALRLSLSEGFSGGVEEVLYYEKEDGERYLRIKNASIELNDQAGLSVGMELIQKNDGFALSVAGGGHFSSVGIVAAGSISTINDDLRFGIFVAASAPINIMGVVEAHSLGGGFYYRPTTENLNMTIQAIESMDDDFHLNGPQPDVQNLKFAALLYAGISIGGSGDNAAISANALIQITDQFTKIDGNGTVFNQGDRFEVGMYLTILYTPEVAGVEGGVNMNITYGEVLSGDSQVDFFAKKDRTNNSALLWGITGNFQLTVINQLDVDGSLIVSPDGLLLQLGAGSGFDIAIISADAGFDLTVWYLPDYRDPFGIYGKFSVNFSIVGGLAEFGAAVEGGYFDRGNYIMLYFAGEAHVSVIGVIDADVRGWVKFQSKSPNFDYGRGGSAEMEQMIADAKAKANETEQKAQETKDDLEQAKDDLNNSIASSTNFSHSAAELEEAGFNRFMTSNIIQRNHVLNNVRQKANALSTASSDDVYPSGEPMPSIATYYWAKDDADQSIQDVQSSIGSVNQRIDQGITNLGNLSARMQAQLEQNSPLGLSNPVTNIQDATTAGQGELISAPSFRVDSAAIDTNKARLNRFESELAAADQRYREAIKAAAANVQLVDLVADGNATVNWSDDTGLQIQSQNGISVNEMSDKYLRAVKDVRKYNSYLIGQYWRLYDWADAKHAFYANNQSSIRSAVEWNSSWNNKLSDVADYAVAMDEAIAELGPGTAEPNIRTIMEGNYSNKESKFNTLA
ncbi:MAG: hypothetical protein PVH63_00155, partial [Balneolaceae bacterium]